MHPSVALLVSLLMVGCASTTHRDVHPGDPLPWRVSPETEPTAGDAPVAPDPAPELAPANAAPATSLALAAPPPSSFQHGAPPPSSFQHGAPPPNRMHEMRYTLKAGHYSLDDADELDNGYIISLAGLRYYNELLAVEVELGYFSADGDEGSRSSDVWGIPFMTNLRANIPLGPFDVYGGVGLGTIYYEAEVDLGPISAEADGFLIAGDAFFGATVTLRDKLTLGLEAKYYVTDEIGSLDTSLDAYAVMATVGFGR
jgi:hypothetical protein